MYVIAFQKAKESVHYFLSLGQISLKFICRHNIIDVSYLQKKVPLGDFVKKQLSTIHVGVPFLVNKKRK